MNNETEEKESDVCNNASVSTKKGSSWFGIANTFWASFRKCDLSSVKAVC